MDAPEAFGIQERQNTGGVIGTLRKLDRPACAILFAAVLIFGAWIRVTMPAATWRSPDEKFYMYFAQATLADPCDAPRTLAEVYNKYPSNWEYPIPLRIGYYYLIASVVTLFHIASDRAGVAISTVSSIVQLAVVALMGLRFFNRWTALAAVALLSVSPQDLALVRRVWGDGPIGCAAMILIWLCAEISVRPHAKPWYAALWIWSAWFMLLKESAGVFFGFCILGLAFSSWRQYRSWPRIAWILAGATAAALFSFLLMAVLCGGVATTLEVVRHNVQTFPVNRYVDLKMTGPWYSLPLGYWVLSPSAALGCAAGLVALIPWSNSLANVLTLNPGQRAIATGLGILIVLVIATASMPRHLMDLRYVTFIVGPWYLMAALALSYIVTMAVNAAGNRAALPIIIAAAIAVLLCCWSDYSRFRELFLQRGYADLDIRDVVTAPFARGF